MNTNVDVAAATPRITNKEIAVHAVKTATSFAHIGFTALADISMYAGAHLVQAIDKTQTVQETTDYIKAKTDIKLDKMRMKLSGYKPTPIEK